MLDLIEIELTRVRRMAEQADDEFLIYLIDMAIIEAHARARSNRDITETANRGRSDRDGLCTAREPNLTLQIVN